MKTVRLDKFLSVNTKYSRSEIKKLVKAGKVTVDGVAAKDYDIHISAANSEITVNSQKIEYKKYVYLIMNKPAGILSACNDKSRKTVVDLVGEEYKHFSLFPVGRLDKDTTGILLLTNDGEFAHKVISPKSNIEKSYIATVDDVPPEDLPQRFKEGIVLADGTVCKSAKAEILKDNKVRIVLTEGKYHQIKRMLGVVGLGVNALHRERIGKITLPENLLPGECVELFDKEICTFFP